MEHGQRGDDGTKSSLPRIKTAFIGITSDAIGRGSEEFQSHDLWEDVSFAPMPDASNSTPLSMSASRKLGEHPRIALIDR
jgi:hypothetical protein